MLVDNAVRNDSRVQKQARSMAELGWDVVLLGKAPGDEGSRWRIGDARVRLVPVPQRSHPHLLRHAGWRVPLAYRSMRHARQRVSTIAARRADAIGRGRAGRVSPGRVLVALQSRWSDLRLRRTTEAVRRRQEMTGPLDRVTTGWWLRVLGDRAWRRLDPQLLDLELAFGPVIDELAPDLIHVNDFRMLGTGARAKVRAASWGRTVPLVWDVHEFLPGIHPWNDHPRWHVAQLAHEREYAPYADEVVTVSEELGALLVAEHGLDRPPTVVLNCPSEGALTARETASSVRAACGVADDVPIMVYSGMAAARRGVMTMVEALPSLPEVVCALVVPRHQHPFVRELLRRARELGVQNRVHLLPYVAPDEVVGYLSSADVGVIPIHHFANHEIALITKFFEYTHAGLPIVVSDVRAMAEQVRRTGQGEVFAADQLDDFVRAMRTVLADPAPYRAAAGRAREENGWTWEAQAEVLDHVYRRAVAGPRPVSASSRRPGP